MNLAITGASGNIVGQQRLASSTADVPALVQRDSIVWQLKDGNLINFRPE